jgi:hypothetical protein
MLVLFLGSCEVVQFIFGSVFPETTTLQTGEADMSGAITSNDGGSYKLRVVETGAFSYVVLVGSPGSSNIATAYIFDLSLGQKKKLTGLLPSGAVFQGSGVMYDGLNDLIAIGNVELVPSDLSLSTELPSGLIISGGGSGGVDGFYNSDTAFNIVSLGIPQGTSNLESGAYNSTWNGLARTPGAYPPTLSSTTNGYSLSGVFDDGNPAGNVILAITQGSNNNGNTSGTTYFVTIPKSGFGASPDGAGLLDTAPQRDNLQANSLGFAQGHIMGWDTVTHSFVRIDPVTMATTASFYAPANSNKSDNRRFAYLNGGGSFYEWDPNTRVITEYTAWW